MGSSCRNTRYDPFALGNLLLDGQMKIGVGLADVQDMFLHALKLVRRDELGQFIDITRVDDFLIETSNEQLVIVGTYDTTPFDANAKDRAPVCPTGLGTPLSIGLPATFFKAAIQLGRPHFCLSG